MAIAMEIDQEAFGEWIKTRPPIIQELCRKFPPDRLYEMSPNGRRVTLYSYEEDGTMTVDVSEEYNALIMERRVFGVKPENLKECDFPSPDEHLGVLFADMVPIA